MHMHTSYYLKSELYLNKLFAGNVNNLHISQLHSLRWQFMKFSEYIKF